jgi:hypothetical protein
VGGRNTYEAAGAWGGHNPFGLPFFIVTHRPEEAPAGAGFTFVNGLDEAIARARDAAGTKDAFVMGGADVIRQALRAGHVDELSASFPSPLGHYRPPEPVVKVRVAESGSRFHSGRAARQRALHAGGSGARRRPPWVRGWAKRAVQRLPSPPTRNRLVVPKRALPELPPRALPSKRRRS